MLIVSHFKTLSFFSMETIAYSVWSYWYLNEKY